MKLIRKSSKSLLCMLSLIAANLSWAADWVNIGMSDAAVYGIDRTSVEKDRTFTPGLVDAGLPAAAKKQFGQDLPVQPNADGDRLRAKMGTKSLVGHLQRCAPER
jgi:hypothetical protein